jgi:double-stranded uracil-DNA glycosylase
MAAKPFRPTKEELAAAVNKTVPDVIAPELKLLFCGINPGLYSAATRHHFAHPGNRFWPAVFAGGFTPEQLSPFDERRLLEWNYGITNMGSRATATAGELGAEELRSGAKRLRRKLKKYKPRFLAVLGVTSYRTAFDEPEAVVGPQSKEIEGTRIWLLPNPSGLNAHFRPKDLAKLFGELRKDVERG